MKKLLLSLMTCVMFGCSANAQDTKQQAPQTKMEAFSSKLGSIVKFTDTRLLAIPMTYGSAKTHIRKINRGADAMYFYQITNNGEYGSKTASIEYSDLLEVIKAFQVLKKDVATDIALNPDYLENKFTTGDGFQLGYYIDKGVATWYFQLEKYGSDNTVFVKDVATIEFSLTEAKNKIEELKSK